MFCFIFYVLFLSLVAFIYIINFLNNIYIIVVKNLTVVSFYFILSDAKIIIKYILKSLMYSELCLQRKNFLLFLSIYIIT